MTKGQGGLIEESDEPILVHFYIGKDVQEEQSLAPIDTSLEEAEEN